MASVESISVRAQISKQTPAEMICYASYLTDKGVVMKYYKNG